MPKLDAVINSYIDIVNTKLDEAIFAENTKYEILTNAMKYSAKDGGKRVRPMLLMEFYKLCGGESSEAIRLAVALEMIHTYSLVHDDLPSMDNDDVRRGKPSCHKAYGEALALLAGDALLTEAFTYAAGVTDIPADRVLKAIGLLGGYAGVNGMIGGQVIDVNFPESLDNADSLKEMYALKTGALLKAAATIGCVLAGADGKTTLAADYAEKIGLAFQIVDDILDVEGDSEKLGKPLGSDEKNNKTTFVTIYGIDKSRQIVKELTNKAKADIDLFGGDGTVLKEFADYLANRTY